MMSTVLKSERVNMNSQYRDALGFELHGVERYSRVVDNGQAALGSQRLRNGGEVFLRLGQACDVGDRRNSNLPQFLD